VAARLAGVYDDGATVVRHEFIKTSIGMVVFQWWGDA
jgi:hypothetical protein